MKQKLSTINIEQFEVNLDEYTKESRESDLIEKLK